MCDVEKYIDAYDEEKNQIAGREIFKFVNDLQKLCEMQKNTTEVSKIKACNPCGCRDANAMKDVLYQDLDEIRNEFLDTCSKLSPIEMALIYQYSEFIKKKY